MLQTSFLGDTVLTLPLLAEIKRRVPSAHLGVLCSPLGRELLRDHPGIDELIVDDKKGLDGGLAGLWRKAKVLRDKNFSVALTPHKSFRTAILLSLARIPCRVGFRQSKGWFLFHHRVNRVAQRHDVERTLSLLEAFGIRPEECERDLQLPMMAPAEGKRLLASLGVDSAKPALGINPGSVWATKRWPPEAFAKLIALIKRSYDYDVLLFGAQEDAEIVGSINRLCGGAAVDLAGRLGLRELPVALKQCRVLVTNDSGPMHIAVACDVATVAIFCATTPDLGFYPYSANSIVIGKDLSCRPCAAHGGRRCPLGTDDCMRLVSPEAVFEAVERLIRRGAERPSVNGSGHRPEFIAL